MPVISPIISDIVATIPEAVYLRDTPNNANLSLDTLEIGGQVLVLYTGLPEVELVSSLGTYDSRAWPVELQILQLADVDETTEKQDLKRSACFAVAEKIWSRVKVDPSLSKVLPLEDSATTEFLEMIEIYDKVMTGLVMNFVFPIDKETYDCG